MVAPYTGAWIEICHIHRHFLHNKSLPTRERGLKFTVLQRFCRNFNVAPYTGAWIEIKEQAANRRPMKSLPTRERGLK